MINDLFDHGDGYGDGHGSGAGSGIYFPLGNYTDTKEYGVGMQGLEDGDGWGDSLNGWAGNGHCDSDYVGPCLEVWHGFGDKDGGWEYNS